ncbi:MAG TPA: cytidylate kinase-like family protein [Pirellulaceae bacterium]|nr:cytidylate kinase-like family protein [Pirellulaceae bacterium]
MVQAAFSNGAAEALLAGEMLNDSWAEVARAPRDSLKTMNVAISRETGTHATEIAHQVGARLAWDVYDHELLERMATQMDVRVNLLENIDERCVNWLQEVTTVLANVPQVRESQYVRQLVETTIALGQTGNAVFVGRGAAWILPPESTVRVALMAPLEYRIVNVMHEREISHKDAAAFVAETDRHHARFAKAHFCREGIDPHAFDLVLNTSRLSLNDCVELIVQGIHDRARKLL